MRDKAGRDKHVHRAVAYHLVGDRDPISLDVLRWRRLHNEPVYARMPVLRSMYCERLDGQRHALAWDDVRARLLRLRSRPLAQDNAEEARQSRLPRPYSS